MTSSAPPICGGSQGRRELGALLRSVPNAPLHAEREGGVGLGLSLVKQIAERHSGSVHCEARDGGGSCFVITLPV